MHRCPWNQNLYLYLTGELEEMQKPLLEDHLASCVLCRKEKEQLSRLIQEFSRQAESDPDEATLRALRNIVALRLKAEEARRMRRLPYLTLKTWVMPLQYAAATVVLVLLGFFIGRTGLLRETRNGQDWQHLLTGEQTVQSGSGAIVPYLAGINKVKFDPKSGRVDVQYNTVNDITYSGQLHSPVVQEVLRRAMMEENTPAVKLQAIKMVNAIAEQDRILDPKFVLALDYLLSEDENPGVRLMALRALRSVAMNETIKKTLLRILLYDPYLPLRIRAFETLTGNDTPVEDMTHFLQTVKKDTSSYLRYKAENLLREKREKQIKTREIGRKD
jgi:hypothetical protein